MQVLLALRAQTTEKHGAQEKGSETLWESGGEPLQISFSIWQRAIQRGSPAKGRWAGLAKGGYGNL